MSLLTEETKSRRQWISTKWTDTQEGEGKEIKLLEYACGPGTISKVGTPGFYMAAPLIPVCIGSRTVRDKSHWY